jgi:hypothetical protein
MEPRHLPVLSLGGAVETLGGVKREREDRSRNTGLIRDSHAISVEKHRIIAGLIPGPTAYRATATSSYGMGS